MELGLARVIGAVSFAFIVGLLMAFFFRKEETTKAAAAMQLPPPEAPRRPFWQTCVFFFSLVFFLIFAAWVTPRDVTIHLKDGQQVQAVVLEERSHDLIFRLSQDWDGKKKELGEQKPSRQGAKAPSEVNYGARPGRGSATDLPNLTKRGVFP